MISFVVSFDFLPTFTEFISLDQIENKKGINKVESAELRSDIEELDRMLSSFSINASNSVSETTHTVNPKG